MKVKETRSHPQRANSVYLAACLFGGVKEISVLVLRNARKIMLSLFCIMCVCVCVCDKEVKVLVTQLCLTLYDSMDCSPLGSSVQNLTPGKNTGVGSHSLLQGTFPTQGSNPGFLHCR